MVKLDTYQTITYKGKKYVVCKIPYEKVIAPVILDVNIFNLISKLNKSWHINDKGFVITTHRVHRDNTVTNVDICMHDLVMRLNGETSMYPIIHINTLGIDNRYENLMLDTKFKDITKNLKKKKRTIVLPKSSKVHVDNIPSFVWYIKEDKSHGDRFAIMLPDHSWKSTSSRKVSLRYKLEETKKYLRWLKNIKSELFNSIAMNGDLNDNGKKLLQSFYVLAKMANFDNLNVMTGGGNTDMLFTEDHTNLTENEIVLLQLFDPTKDRINFR
jgi:hypothetical protein